MNEISTLITTIYFVIGILVLRQIFKRNILLRCTNCKKMGSLRIIDSVEIDEPLVIDDNILDTEQVSRTQLGKAYQCKKCGHIIPIV